MDYVHLLSRRHAMAQQSGWQRAASAHLSAVGGFFAALVAGRETNRLQWPASCTKLEYLPHAERWRHSAALTSQHGGADGRELVAGRKLAGLLYRWGAEGVDFDHQPENQAGFHLARFQWTLFSALVARWKVHCGHNSCRLYADDL